MESYQQLKLEDREKIYQLRKRGLTLRALSEIIGKSASTISRELRRNSDSIGYLPDRADNNAKARRYKLKKKIDRHPKLKQYILDRLIQDKWSPEIIVGRMKVEKQEFSISHESIYKYIYSKEGQGLGLYKHLMYKRVKRSFHGARKHRETPPQYRIENRSEAINNREEFGHFEGDLTFFKGSNSANLAVLIERVSRKVHIIKNNSKRSIPVTNNIAKSLSILHPNARKSITFDNGKEFARFGTLSLMGLGVFFCKPASPWQKGAVERLNAQLHKFIPKSKNICNINHDQVLDAQIKLNHLPRKVLGFLTPNEVWDKHLKNTVALQI